jgi:hypothetical protein
MNKHKISKAMRFFLFVSGTFVWTGIWLTGFDVVHWVLYLPAIFFAFAVITGICPGLIVSNLLFGEESTSSDKQSKYV